MAFRLCSYEGGEVPRRNPRNKEKSNKARNRPLNSHFRNKGGDTTRTLCNKPISVSTMVENARKHVTCRACLKKFDATQAKEQKKRDDTAHFDRLAREAGLR